MITIKNASKLILGVKGYGTENRGPRQGAS